MLTNSLPAIAQAAMFLRAVSCKTLGASFLLLLLALAGCDRQSRGFALPPGDPERGLATFKDLGCHNCHHIDGVVEHLDGGDIDVRLGGRVTRVKTYGDLVTSIIHPSHELSRGKTPSTINEDGSSRMPDYNDVMSVAELVDLTTFLQTKYSVWVPEHYYP